MTKREQRQLLYFYGAGMLGAMGLHMFVSDWAIVGAMMLTASAIGVYLGVKAPET